jgi:hypothetical protein
MHRTTQFASHKTARATDIERTTYRDKWQLLVGCQQGDMEELQTVQAKWRGKELL